MTGVSRYYYQEWLHSVKLMARHNIFLIRLMKINVEGVWAVQEHALREGRRGKCAWHRGEEGFQGVGDHGCRVGRGGILGNKTLVGRERRVYGFDDGWSVSGKLSRFDGHEFPWLNSARGAWWAFAQAHNSMKDPSWKSARSRHTWVLLSHVSSSIYFVLYAQPLYGHFSLSPKHEHGENLRS